jgi:hypothetical protein
MIMLSKQDHGRSRVADSTHEIRALFPCWLDEELISYLNLRHGWGKQRTASGVSPDGKVESG